MAVHGVACGNVALGVVWDTAHAVDCNNVRGSVACSVWAAAVRATAMRAMACAMDHDTVDWLAMWAVLWLVLWYVVCSTARRVDYAAAWSVASNKVCSVAPGVVHVAGLWLGLGCGLCHNLWSG